MFERFTDRARRVVVLSQEEARNLQHNYIGTEHILLGLIHEGEGVAAKALAAFRISLDDLRAKVEAIIGQGQQPPSGHIPFTPRAKKVYELALREALQLGHNYIGTEHLLLGLIREGEGVGAQVLVQSGADLNRVRQQVLQLLSGYRGAEPAVVKVEGRLTEEQRKRWEEVFNDSVADQRHRATFEIDAGTAPKVEPGSDPWGDVRKEAQKVGYEYARNVHNASVQALARDILNRTDNTGVLGFERTVTSFTDQNTGEPEQSETITIRWRPQTTPTPTFNLNLDVDGRLAQAQAAAAVAGQSLGYTFGSNTINDARKVLGLPPLDHRGVVVDEPKPESPEASS